MFPRWLKSRDTDRAADLVRFPIALAAVIMSAFIVLSGAGLLLWLGLGSPPIGAAAPPASMGSGSPGPVSTAQLTTQDQLNLVQIALIITGGLGGVVALVVAYRKQRIAEDAHRWADEANRRAVEASKRDDTRLFNERFTTASAQLGHESAAVRLAGVYAIAGLADDWEAGRQTCIDVLCAYLRMPYQPDAEATVGPTWKEGEREVRWSIISIISDRLRDYPEDIDRQNRTWQGHNLDFTGAVFDGGDFSRANFTGLTKFNHATFMDGIVGFTSATFSTGTVMFDGSTFSGGMVTFEGAKFSGGRVVFTLATFSGGIVRLDRAKFSDGVVGFTAAKFSGADVTFSKARFHGSKVGFLMAKFSGGRVGFDRASFSGGTVQFSEVTFDGGTLDLSNVGEYGTPAIFDKWSTPPQGLILPPAANAKAAGNRQKQKDAAADRVTN